MTPAQLVNYLSDTHNLLIGEKSAEKALVQLASMPTESDQVESMTIRGRNRITGFPTGIMITYFELRQASLRSQIEDQ